MIRILVAEDSPVQRDLLLFVLEEAGGFEVVGTPSDGVEAVACTERLRPDIVLMDCHMPNLGGIAATRQIMQRCPTPIVIASASFVPDDLQVTFDALRNGALAVVPKPASLEDPGFERLASHLILNLRLMSEVKVVRRWAAQAAPATAPGKPAVVPAPLRVIAMAGSTGAPAVIADVLAAVGSKLNCPVLVVQHLAESFVDGFAIWLARRTGLDARVARHGMQAVRGCIYLAPDDLHLGIDMHGRLVLAADAAEEGFRPCANYLFRSVAASHGRSALGVLLTGMGRDGAAGLLELRKAGADTVAQDEQSCVVFGMPGEAIRLDAASHVLPPLEIAALIASRQQGDQGRGHEGRMTASGLPE